MIKSIEVKNFRSWKHIKIELDAGVNVFVGDNDQGKTNLQRALNWIINNKPSGDSYRSYWALEKNKKTIVRIQLDNEYIIERGRNNSDNWYAYEINGNREELRAFGSSVPETISNILNIKDINIQSQLGSPFLLGSSPSEVSRYLNGIADLSVIDSAYKNINSYRKKAVRGYEDSKIELGKLEAELKKFSDIKDAEMELEKLENLETALTTLNSNRNRLSNIVLSIDKNNRSMARFPHLLGQSIIDINLLIDNTKKLDLKIMELNKKTNNLYYIINSIEKQEEKLKSFPKNIGGAIKEADDLLTKKDEFDKLTDNRNRLFEIIEKHKGLSKKISFLKEAAKQIQKDIDKIYPSICPFCSAPIKKRREK